MTAVAELRRLSGSYYIDGAFSKSTSGAGHDVIDPATEDPIGEIADCAQDEVEQAGFWKAMIGQCRIAKVFCHVDPPKNATVPRWRPADPSVRWTQRSRSS